MLVDFQPVTCPGRQCLVLGVRRASKTSGLNGSRWNEGAACPGSQPALGGISTALGRFESHLGHGFSVFRGLSASECAQMFTCRGPLGPFLLVAVGVAGRLLWRR